MTMAQGAKRISTAMYPSLFTSLRGPSGEPWWFSITTSAFRAKDKVILSRKCLDVMIERVEAGESLPSSEELRLIHSPIRLGVRAHSGRVGRFLLETGPWDDTPMARFMQATLEAEPDVWCVSVRFEGDGLPDADGVLDSATLIERSVVPVKYAKEPWTSISTMTHRRSTRMDIMTLLRSMLPQAADEVLEDLERRAKELDEEDVDSRADIAALAADIVKGAEEGTEEGTEGERATVDGEEGVQGATANRDGGVGPPGDRGPEGLSLESLSERINALDARFEDVETAVEGLAARQPKTEEVVEEVARASRAAVSAELAGVTDTLQLLRSLLDPQGQRQGATETEGGKSDAEIAAAIKAGLDATEKVDPVALLYL